MALYQDNEAERLARVEQLLMEARVTQASLRPDDHQQRRELAFQLDKLLEDLLGWSVPQRHASKDLR